MTFLKSNLRVLNLEDSVNDFELNEAMISARWPQCRLLRVDNREDFLAALQQEKFDLILSDYTMPGFNGCEALTLARTLCPEVPFLFVSGTIGEDSAIETLKNGATDYVLKHRLMRLIPAVDRALREAEARAERDRAEAAMRESEHKYRTLFESLNDAAFLADEETGKIIDVNQSAEALLGLERRKILGRKQSDFLLSGDHSKEKGAVPVQRRILHTHSNRSVPVEIHSTWLTLYNRPLVLRLCHEVAEW